jgi:hypothetical protein
VNETSSGSRSVRAHQLAWLAAGLRRAASSCGVELPASYSEAITRDGIEFCDQLAVTQIGRGVVIHTAPEESDRLPIILGYADSLGHWYRNGQRHSSTARNHPEWKPARARSLER